MSYYVNPSVSGILSANSVGDGYAITLKWASAYLSGANTSLGYNIYFTSTDNWTWKEDQIFKLAPSFFSTGTKTSATLLNFNPGELYFFAVRAVEYASALTNVASLSTVFNTLKAYPISYLANSVGLTDNSITLVDGYGFPTYGYVRVGTEVMHYSSINYGLGVLNIDERGSFATPTRIHQTDGYDGYYYQNKDIILYLPEEEINTKVFRCQSRFEFPHQSFTIADGYAQRTKDILTTDLSISDAENINFPRYDYASYHMSSPLDIINGNCTGSYIGGEQYCADGYDGVGRVLRGMSLQDANLQRQEMLIESTGEPVVLFSKQRTGIICACYTANKEYADDRCPRCYGTGFVIGWQQYFNPRRADSRLLVKFNSFEEDLKTTETGLESDATADCWTLTVPTIKDRDFIIRFDENDNEEFRYEVISVTRTKFFNRLQAVQKFKVQRVRKTDPIYQVPSFNNTSYLPSKLTTSISSSIGIQAHTHQIVVSENITNINQINQLTSMSAGHAHVVKSGIILAGEIGHTHTIVLV